MSIVDTLPPVIFAAVSSTLIILQAIKNRKKYFEIPSDEVPDDVVDNARFSTVKRDAARLGITISQTGLFSFLFFWRFRHGNNLNFDTISPGILAICWFYALTISIIALSLKSRRWRWTLNAYLTAFFFISSLCSLWQSIKVIKLNGSYRVDEIIEKLTVICSFVFSIVATSIAITTPIGPPILQNGRAVCAIEYCSIWDFITFSTVSKLIFKAYKQKTFNNDDLDLLPFAYQAKSLYNAFKKTRGSKLLYRILVVNKHVIGLQLLFTMMGAALYYAPIIFLYRFLSFIQTRPENGFLELGFVYVVGMLVSYIMLHFTLEQNRYWAANVFNISVKGMLNSEIYSKSLRRINSHASTVKDKCNKSEDNLNNVDNDNLFVGKVTNLMSIDTNRVSKFSEWWTNTIDSPIELVIGVYFLYQLMGVSCLLGLLVMIITLPINHQMAKLYAKTQDELMNARDRRVGLMNEVLQSIRMIKFLSWEKNWENKVRKIELKQLRNHFIYLSIIDLLWMASPILVTILSFFFFTKVQGNELTAAIAFTSLAVFNELRFALNTLPEAFMDALQALVSMRRIENFLDEDEIDIPPENNYQFMKSISFEKATVSWNKIKENSNEFIMQNLDLEFPVGELNIILSHITFIKNGLILLSTETNIISGKINSPRCLTYRIDKNINENNWILPNCTAYVAQQAWLQNASIRDNVLFGLPYNENRYNQVIKACALEKDFQILEDGDLTEIGEKGITLSGGQKMRLEIICNFYRAVYSRAKHIYIDDVFSAVDVHTAWQLMNKCLLGPIMKGRTRILVTNNIRLCLAGATYLVAVDNGKIVTSSVISELHNSGKLASISDKNGSQSELVNSIELSIENFVDVSKVTEQLISSSANFDHSTDSSTASDAILIENVAQVDDSQQTKKVFKPRVLIKEEARPTGVVKFKIYKSYFRANGNILYWFIAAVVFIGARGIQIIENWWLQVWSNANNNNETVPTTCNLVQQDNDRIFGDIHKSYSVDYYLNIYVLIAFLSIITGVSRFVWLFYGSLRASKKLYQLSLHQVIRAPLRFFDTTPVGRILNRFSKDFETIDSTLAAGIFILWNLDHIDAGLAGLSLSFAMHFTKQIMWTVRKYTSLEMSLNAVERISEFSEIPQEAPAIIEPRPPACWPHNGTITVQNLEVKYAPDLEPVLHRISFNVESQEKIGLVGRTGSGKSTISLALFRFVEPSYGKILIDEIDISSIGVEDLRSRITIIPQDPILFTGTIRSNLDAFSQYEDSEILESLRRVHLIPSSEDVEATSFSRDDNNLFKNLNTPVSEGGKNFSQGQRQLLCLARALLRSSKIILMDEATARYY
ncbi:46446_t:CDS:10 [Gigaspora margarita]|uniref:46446_t:CDS:1 n=1 Tax=Gigaspora margarita TaxID=4874 RepID=A0ABN7V7C9_GIGMA|nr:46446_t:CDS:10 [Gigaspora margarita]